ncbi:MAG: signal peptide peptidase SppA [Phycisphaerae bacterium]
MKHQLFAILGLVTLFGCTPMAYKVTPIPMTERLDESVVACDRGILLPKVALIDIDGVILNARDTSLLGSGDNPTALVMEKLQKAAEDPHVKAVVLRINSPGGGVTASDIIYRQVLKVKCGDKSRGFPAKPVVAAMMDVAASGGYYIACAASEIYAEPTTVTGSIGVIMLTLNAKGLLDKIGVSTDAIKSGAKKDIGSPFRPMQPDERKIFQDMINEFYNRFVDVVAQSRTKISKSKVRELADGRVYSGEQAQKLSLIDKVDGLDGAIKHSKELAGIQAAKVVMYHRPVGYRGSIYSAAEPMPVQKNETNLFNVRVPDLLPQQGAFMYLWQPQ